MQTTPRPKPHNKGVPSRRTVQVEDAAPLRHGREQPPPERRRQRLAARHELPQPQRAALRLEVRRQQLEHGGDAAQVRHAPARQRRRRRRRPQRPAVRQDDAVGAGEQRREELPDVVDERRRRRERDGVAAATLSTATAAVNVVAMAAVAAAPGGAQRRRALHPVDAVQQASGGAADAERRASRARGVQDVGDGVSRLVGAVCRLVLVLLSQLLLCRRRQLPDIEHRALQCRRCLARRRRQRRRRRRGRAAIDDDGAGLCAPQQVAQPVGRRRRVDRHEGRPARQGEEIGGARADVHTA